MLTKGALTGIRVLDLSRLLPGPYCSMILADHGADVIAVEGKKFQSDGMFFKEISRNKRHVSLNLKTREGKAIFLALASKTDVILEGFRPGVVKTLGVDYETVKAVNPGVIYCSITGYGQTGPMWDRVGHDVNYLSISGVLDLIGEKGHPPSIPGVQFADIAGGSMNAVIGILLALFAREKNGKGQYIDISMTDGMIGYLTLPSFFTKLTGQRYERSETKLSHRFACYNTYETSDHKYIAIGAVEERFWRNLCEHLGVPEYTSLQYDEDRRQELIAFMRKTFAEKSLEEWEEEFLEVEVCHSRIQGYEEVLRDPLFLEREMIVPVLQRDGTLSKSLGIPVKMSETPGSLRTPPVDFGEHTREVLGELGYTDGEIDDFMTRGIV
ncbi:CoA transferase [Desulfoprunum benzoelyticum]|uniref:Crotonobetainyl-CoA:carnitine CoA-transferase CaiB-like acyl-CoA transferase n=1 Tax=Desulfoprunum benzoelyticum TaxID=1506996 RepID=A0A840UY28_9BACT|nr:CaiB/BaiF CoA-transferase family protein [Desulfoprunum benzoelyticum]MBB5346400.1 crotonobetainyl-CoA:carnitine CoA-transferase CaiB-like acyl-CoA transferase [Desulfoprunum benzoelyticum]MBM9528601.1 CoA transferase [Desulfoprunum benzoelyticum]